MMNQNLNFYVNLNVNGLSNQTKLKNNLKCNFMRNGGIGWI